MTIAHNVGIPHTNLNSVIIKKIKMNLSKNENILNNQLFCPVEFRIGLPWIFVRSHIVKEK